MADFVILNPADFSMEDLITAVKGESAALSPQTAVVLLESKLGADSRTQLTELAKDSANDLRARHAAVLALGSFAEARDDLLRFADSPEQLIAEAAAQALTKLTRHQSP
jgi:hypothetical protein